MLLVLFYFFDLCFGRRLVTCWSFRCVGRALYSMNPSLFWCVSHIQHNSTRPCITPLWLHLLWAPWSLSTGLFWVWGGIQSCWISSIHAGKESLAPKRLAPHIFLQSLGQLAGCFLSWLVGWLFGWLVGLLVRWVGLSVVWCCLASWFWVHQSHFKVYLFTLPPSNISNLSSQLSSCNDLLWGFKLPMPLPLKFLWANPRCRCSRSLTQSYRSANEGNGGECVLDDSST